MASVQELTNRLENIAPLAAKINSLDAKKTNELPNLIEKIQESLSVAQNIIKNSLQSRAEESVLIIEPVNEELITGIPIFPAIPSSNGTYFLQATVINGQPSISWVIEE